MKISQDKKTKYCVHSHEAAVIARGNLLNMEAIELLEDRARFARSSRPWMKPQSTKFQEAPCQSPPSSIVAMSAMAIALVPFLLPPKGM